MADRQVQLLAALIRLDRHQDITRMDPEICDRMRTRHDRDPGGVVLPFAVRFRRSLNPLLGERPQRGVPGGAQAERAPRVQSL